MEIILHRVVKIWQSAPVVRGSTGHEYQTAEMAIVTERGEMLVVTLFSDNFPNVEAHDNPEDAARDYIVKMKEQA